MVPPVASGTLSGVPTSGTAGSALAGTITFTASNVSTPYATLVTSAATVGQAVGSALIGSAVALSGSSGTLPAITPMFVGTGYLALLDGPAGIVLYKSGGISLAAPNGESAMLIGVPSTGTVGTPLPGITYTASFPSGSPVIAPVLLQNGVQVPHVSTFYTQSSGSVTNLQPTGPGTFTAALFDVNGIKLWESGPIVASAAASESASLSNVPSSTISAIGFSCNFTQSGVGTLYGALLQNGVEIGFQGYGNQVPAARQLHTTGLSGLSGATPPLATSGNVTFALFDALTGGTKLYESAPISVTTLSASFSNVPASGVVGTAVSGADITITPGASDIRVYLYNGGTRESLVAIDPTTGALPAFTPTAAGTHTLRAYLGFDTNGTLLATSTAINVA